LTAAFWILLFMAIVRVTALASLIVSFYFLIANLTLEDRHGDSSKKHEGGREKPYDNS
jgi:hypothetical protein